jgi:hypothetical protein
MIPTLTFPHYVNRSFAGSRPESWQLQMSAGDKFPAIIMGAGLAAYLYIAFAKYKPLKGPWIWGLLLTLIGSAITIWYFL